MTREEIGRAPQIDLIPAHLRTQLAGTHFEKSEEKHVLQRKRGGSLPGLFLGIPLDPREGRKPRHQRKSANV